MKAHLTITVSPKLVNIDRAWWFPEKNPGDLYGVWESNANELVPAVFGRTGMGVNCKSLICKIYKVKEGEM